MTREEKIQEMKDLQAMYSADKFEVKSDRETKKSLFIHHLRRIEEMKQKEK
jgi:putative IMPACT (imprinted ancient) family translation regulator